MLRKYPLPPFIRNVLAVGGLTAAGQVIATAVAPALTRVYSPALFGLFGAFSAVMLPFANVCCLKYDNAIVLERDDRDCRAVVLVSGLAALATTAVFYIGVLAFCAVVPGARAQPATGLLLVFGGPTIISSALFAIGLGLKTRASQFHHVGQSQVVRPTMTAASQLGLALTSLAGIGLPLGQLIGQLSGVCALLRAPNAIRIRDVVGTSWAAARDKLDAHRHFLFYSSPQSVLNAMTTSTPMLMLGWLFDNRAVGFFWLSYRVLILPSLIVAESVRGAFYRQAVTVFHEGGDLRREVEKTTALLFVLILPAVIVLVVAGPWLFSLVFGSAWRTAGEYARLIAVPWMLSIAQVPANVVVPILGAQREFLIQECLGLALRTCALMAGAAMGSAVMAVLFYSIAASVAPVLWIVYIAIRARSVHGEATASG